VKLKNSIVLSLLLTFGLPNFVGAMEVAQTKVEETQKSKLERAKKFIGENPKTAIAIAAVTLLVAGGIGLGAHRLKTGRWIWSKQSSSGADQQSTSQREKGLEPITDKQYKAVNILLNEKYKLSGLENALKLAHERNVKEPNKVHPIYLGDEDLGFSMSNSEYYITMKNAYVAKKLNLEAVSEDNKKKIMKIIAYNISNPEKISKAESLAELMGTNPIVSSLPSGSALTWTSMLSAVKEANAIK
jgi:hypothetical protein